MQTKIKQSVISGIIATTVMSLLMMLGGAMGMPKMSPPDMLTGMMGVPVAIGWALHFIIGILFAASYIFLFSHWLNKISNRAIRGAVFGIIAFIVAQISFPIMGAMFGNAAMPQPQGSPALMMIGSVMGHIVFGMVVVLTIRPASSFTKQILR